MEDKLNEATELLAEYFGDFDPGKAVLVREIMGEAKKRGISRADMKCAKNAWLLRTVLVGADWYWVDDGW